MTPHLFITYLLALMSCLNAEGQKKDTTKYGSYASIDFHISYDDRIQLITEMNGKKDTSVYIQGDTMTLIKNLLIDYFKLAQRKDTVKPGLQDLMVNSLDTINVISPDSLLTWSNGTMTQKTIPSYDTVRVILLVCDISAIELPGRWVDSVSGSHLFIRQIKDTIYDYRTYWQFGYEVREKEPGILYYDQGMTPKWATPFRHVSYLDDRRKPLSRNLIVWQSIKL